MPRSSLAELPTRLLGAYLAVLLLGVAACGDRGSGPLDGRGVSLELRPRFGLAVQAADRPINRIRLVATKAEGGEELGRQEAAVDPNAERWPMTLDVRVPGGASVAVTVSIELLHAGGATASVEWSGRAGPILVRPGSHEEVADVLLGRGPLGNLDVTGLALSPPEGGVEEGATFTPALSVQGSASARVFWTSLDEAVATVSDAGLVSTLRDGTARIVASAGRHADTIAVTVAPRPASITFSADSVRLASLGAEGSLTASVLDPRGGPVAGAAVEWSVADPAVATHQGNGVFRAVANGTTAVTAAVVGRPAVTRTTGVRVTQAVASVAVSPRAATVAIGSTTTLSLSARDANGHPVANPTVTWESADVGKATVSAAGVVTGVAPGDVYVRGRAGGVADSALVTVGTPSIAVALASVDRVSRGHTTQLAITLNVPAPAGGLAVTVTSGNASVLSVGGGGTVTVPAGQSAATIAVTGVSAGTATVTAAASGYTSGSVSVIVEVRALSSPATLNVPFGQTATLPITLSNPAPPGGLVVTVASGDPLRVEVRTASVTIPAGALSGNATVFGAGPGTATLSLSAPNFDPASTAATTTAALDITAATASLNASFGTDITIRFTSNGAAVPAPSPGVTVNLVALDPACVAVPATATIPTGLVDVTVRLTYSGPTNPPCTTRVRATATNIQPDSVTASVGAAPGFSVTSATVGAGLMRNANVFLGATNHGGTTVRVASANPEALLVSQNVNNAGTAFIDVPVLAGNNFLTFAYHAVEGARGATTVSVTAPGFTSGTGTATVVQPALDISGLPTSLFTFSPDDAFSVRVGVPTSTNGDLAELQAVRIGAAALTATVTTSSSTVGRLVTSNGAGLSGTVTIQPGQSSSPGSVATGGIAFDPLAGGTTTVAASIPGYVATTSTTSGASINVTVTTPGVSIVGVAVGAGLMRATTVTLGASDHGGTTVRVTSADPGRLLVSASATEVGAGAIDVPVAAGTTSFTLYYQAIEDTTGTVQVTASAPGFNTGTATVTLSRPGIDISGLLTAINTLDPDDAFTVRLGLRNGAGTDLLELQSRRPGAAPLDLTVTSSAPAVGQLVQTAGASATATVRIPAGQTSSPSLVSAGGVALRPVANGTTTVAVAIPQGYLPTTSTTSGSSIAVTVTQPTTSLSMGATGSGLMRSASVSLSAAGHGGVTVRLTSANPSVALLSTGPTVAGAASIDVPVPAGNFSAIFYVHGVEGVGNATPVTVTATTPGFADGSGTVNVVPAGIDISGLLTAINTLDPDDAFTVRTGIRNASGTDLVELQALRAGAPAVTVTVTSSNTAVGLVKAGSGGTGGASAQLTIVAGQSSTGAAAATSFFHDPVGNGTTTIAATAPGFLPTTSRTSGSAIDVSVTPPAITVGAATVGSGLMRASSVILGAPGNGVTVQLCSSQPTVALVSGASTAAGAACVDVVVPGSAVSFAYWVHGLEGQTGTVTITARASGYSDGSNTATVVQPGLSLESLAASYAAGAPDDPIWVAVGLLNATGTDLVEHQAVRAGSAGFTATLTSSNAAAAQLKRGGPDPQAGGTVTVLVPAGQSTSPTTSSATVAGAAIDPLAGGSTTIAATIPGLRATTGSSTGSTRTVTINP